MQQEQEQAPQQAQARVTRSVAPAAVAAAVPRAGGRTDPPECRGDLLGRQLARAVQRRSSQRVLQRAIIAIKGKGESAASTLATQNCLENLKVRATRGAYVGPAVIGAFVEPPLGPDETLYILAHGGPLLSKVHLHGYTEAADTVGGLKEDALGRQIIAWYGTQDFTGQIKLVSCLSAGTDLDLRNGKSYAHALAEWFTAYAANNPAATFRPASVDGIIGIGWVDEKTSKQQSISLDTYTTYPLLHAHFAETDMGKRETGLAAYATKSPSGGEARITGKGTAKRRYLV